jgi:hypothetical protein
LPQAGPLRAPEIRIALELGRRRYQDEAEEGLRI